MVDKGVGDEEAIGREQTCKSYMVAKLDKYAPQTKNAPHCDEHKLPEELEEICTGLILSDAHIMQRKVTYNACMVFGQTASKAKPGNQELYWDVAGNFRNYLTKNELGIAKVDKKGDTSITLKTRQLPCFNELRMSWYGGVGNKSEFPKRLPVDFEQKLTPN